ncbi:zinc-ribbon domain-containing protein [Mycobacterium sp. 1274761.0]|nr:zinc-ribbon domain-containing protein [Mycobacterium sp. 1274761.0]OBK76824.1 zinc-ribbon domain-containing protein [Mycobacterium sp. 1274761.0]
MFLLFGFASKQKVLGVGQVRTCPHCHNNAQWTRMQEFKQFTVFFVPLARWGRREFEVCGICGQVLAA